MKMRYLRFSWCFPIVLLCVFAVAMFAAEVGPPKEDLIRGKPSGPWRRLFLDAMVVEQSEGLERVFHAARKHEGNPVLRKDKPWEGSPTYSGPYIYGTVMWDGGKLRMWYHAWTNGAYFNPYAESEDGIHWTKPNLGIIEFNGSKENNLFLTTSPKDEIEDPKLYKGQGKCHNPSVIKRPWVSDPEKRYALFCFGQEYRHSRVAFSADGLHWEFTPETVKKGLFGSSDVVNFFYDPYQSRYVATLKCGNRRGRAVGVATSRDGLKWEKPVQGPIFVADDLDPDATQIYGMPVFPYQGLYIGQAWIYGARWPKGPGAVGPRLGEAEKGSPGSMDVQLAWSWDLVNWTRPPKREQFIPRGKEGEFDSTMIYTARGPVQMGHELWFYYGGFNGPHYSRTCLSHIGLAKLRIDGFCSMRAGQTEGSLISRREPLVKPAVTINAKTAPEGYVTAELLDRNNNVVPGFSREQCNAFTGDAIAHVLTWKTAELPEDMLDPDKKIRFILKKADLYSYLPDQTTRPKSVIYDPSANGGLLPDDKKIPEKQRFRVHGKRSGYKIVKDGDRVYLDLHSKAADKTTAACYMDADWDDETDWCIEAWYRIVDKGDEPNYGLATSMRPDSGRNAAIYFSDDAVGINSTQGLTKHITLKKVPMDTTDRFHWYRMVHTGGADGVVTLSVDGKEVIRMPYRDLYPRAGRGYNIGFGPNAGHREGRMHVAKFGFRIGSTEQIFGPVE